MSKLRIVTLNIRRDRGDDGINNWGRRRHLVEGMLERVDPDVVAFQEVLVHQLHDLQDMLSGFDRIGVGRDDGAEAGEFAPIFHRGPEVRDCGTFWFSDAPDVPGRTWPGMTRICTWASFGGETPFGLFNVHLEYEFESTQLKSVELLRQRVEAHPATFPVVMTGDFNFNPGTTPYAAMSDFACDAFAHIGEAGAGQNRHQVTCHDFTGRTERTDSGAGRIDYVWLRGRADALNTEILTQDADGHAGVFISDHWPLVCDVEVAGG